MGIKGCDGRTHRQTDEHAGLINQVKDVFGIILKS